MGSIKNNKLKEEKHTLTDAEFNYVMNANRAKQQHIEADNLILSAFLNYVAKSRLGYEVKQDLQFELDFSDNSHTLKVIKL
jgi:hypothetical protein